MKTIQYNGEKSMTSNYIFITVRVINLKCISNFYWPLKITNTMEALLVMYILNTDNPLTL